MRTIRNSVSLCDHYPIIKNTFINHCHWSVHCFSYLLFAYTSVFVDLNWHHDAHKVDSLHVFTLWNSLISRLCLCLTCGLMCAHRKFNFLGWETRGLCFVASGPKPRGKQLDVFSVAAHSYSSGPTCKDFNCRLQRISMHLIPYQSTWRQHCEGKKTVCRIKTMFEIPLTEH